VTTELYKFNPPAADGKPHVIELQLPMQLDVIAFDDLNNALLGYISTNRADYVIDLAGTDYIGSAVLGLLVNLRTRIKRAGGRLVLCQLSPGILEIFKIGALETLFVLATTRNSAVAKLK
jgi:anti-anti-sigma factor